MARILSDAEIYEVLDRYVGTGRTVRHPDEVALELAEARAQAFDPTPEVRKVIKAGHAAPRTWDEINSTRGGGADHTLE